MVSASATIYRAYLKLWIKLFLFFGLCFGGGFLIYYFLPFSGSNFNSLQIGNLTNSIFDPSVTVAGIITGFFPLIGFYYIAEVKEIQKEEENSIKKEINNYLNFADSEFNEQDLKARALMKLAKK